MATRARDARTGVDDLAPFVPWPDFLRAFMAAWKPNIGGKAQHVSMVGPNGQGKTHLALRLLQARHEVRGAHVVILATKPRDQTLTALGWPVIRRWPPGYGQETVIYWPKRPKGASAREAINAQRLAFRPVLADLFESGRRTVYIDEAAYFAQDLRLEDELRQLWQMGRSQDLIVVAGTQRPTGVPRPMFSEPAWFFAFRTADEDELRRVSEIGGVDTKALRSIMRTMPPHEFVACQTRTGRMVRSKVVERRRG